MITTKERSILKKIAHPLKPECQIGKGGITEALLAQIAECLYHKELIKIKVLQNAPVVAKEVINEMAETLGAQPVSAIGGIITLYKESEKEGIVHVM
ncbi:MAG: YhbY family RNA-binding protein [Bacillota bacterium]